MATHPLSNMTVKEELVRRVVDTLLRYGHTARQEEGQHTE